uniref:ubiquitinyl hydrolase 1 n=1 Tax=Ditylenchus dipsaci TaxID=166011 RepID=A0A915DVN6_9BILA
MYFLKYLESLRKLAKRKEESRQKKLKKPRIFRRPDTKNIIEETGIPLSLLVKRLVFPLSSRDISTKASFINCTECSSRLSALMCCCFDCAVFACLKHIRPHMQSKSHFMAVSTNFGEIFCFKCNDFVYDRRVEKRTGQYGQHLFYELYNPDPAAHPMLRDYFLSDQHNCQSVIFANESNKCLMCELAKLFQEFYGGEVVPYVPHKMLHLVWTHAEHLAGYEQHDAHEFLISALNVLHKHSESISMKVNPHECKCIIDRLFTGQLQSDLTCTRCGRVSTTVDPYWDISLELLNGLNKRANSGAGSSDLSSSMKERSLDECLENFVKPENLGIHSKIKCDNCGSYEESTKQLTLRNHCQKAKIKDPVKYPEFIDLTPYTTAHRNSSLSSTTKLDNGPDSVRHLARLTNRYSLIAVIISREKVDQVLKSEGYLLFYCKMFIDYD